MIKVYNDSFAQLYLYVGTASITTLVPLLNRIFYVIFRGPLFISMSPVFSGFDGRDCQKRQQTQEDLSSVFSLFGGVRVSIC